MGRIAAYTYTPDVRLDPDRCLKYLFTCRKSEISGMYQIADGRRPTRTLALSQADLRTRFKQDKLEAVFPNDQTYGELSKAYNRRYHYKPVAIVFPQSTKDLSKIVMAAAAESFPVSVRSGGHSYTAASLGGKDGFVVVDLSKMKRLTIDRAGIANVQPGNLLGEVAKGLFRVGKVVPMGSCPLVGIGGHAAFGGYNLFSRALGLTLDTVVGLQVVLANGSVIETSPTQHKDLHWGLRGAAPSFGIVSLLKLKTLDLPRKVTSFEFTWKFTSTDKLGQAISAYQHYCLTAQLVPEIGMEVNLSKGGTAEISFTLVGTLFGSETELNPLVAPLLANMPMNLKKNVKDVGWLSTLGLPIDQSSKNVNAFYAKSLVTPEARPATNSSLKTLADYCINKGTASSLSWFVQLQLYGGKGSLINSVSRESSAYPHRDSLWTIQFYASTGSKLKPFPSDGFKFLDGMVDTLVSNNPKNWAGGYLNYLDDRVSDWPQFYYGDRYEKLQELKKVYDPLNLFRYTLAIKLPPA
ncbi:hypothetical protein CROQUDRAFT_719983 [Cronartium quercuum f. sp. fusiforme G11]|uniref:FAD-binding PCMH-type domain-containing protein n=1 Tax=Cronartium quercuum f. sp. fusiforme G11 TaxID=708437 RepID=A0A9P6NW29_9BASI|nr:hypothetical protein CROQUDRAFT_719983 [Cronartium quercuum f. sp. fusiforme G11]